ncbi:MAG: CPBP family intramembrane metalloprotease [Firmicutes bacterium]|nr:CPBP family intramembrane metalloprotease [Bacillota bacterium]
MLFQIKSNRDTPPKNKLIRFEEGTALLFFTIATFLAMQIVVVIIAGFLDSVPTIMLLSLSLLIHLIYIGLYYSLIARRRRVLIWDVVHRPHNGQKLSTKRYIIFILLAVVIGLIALPAFLMPTMWYTAFFSAITSFTGTGLGITTTYEVIVAFIMMVLVAPISEELIFRGALLSGLRRQTTPIKAVMLSSFAFMIFHMNPSQVFFQFILGVIMAFAVMFSGKLIVGIVIHAVSNFLAMLLMILGLYVRDFNKIFYSGLMQWLLIDNTLSGFFIMIGLLVVLGGAIVGIMFLYKKWASVDEPLPEAVEPVLVPKEVHETMKAQGLYEYSRTNQYNPHQKPPYGYPPQVPPNNRGNYSHPPPQAGSTSINPFFEPYDMRINGNQEPLDPNLVDSFGKPLDPFAPPIENKLLQNKEHSLNATTKDNFTTASLLDPPDNHMIIESLLTRIQHERRTKAGWMFFAISLSICGFMWLLSFVAGLNIG